MADYSTATLDLVVNAKSATKTIENFDKKTSALSDSVKTLTGTLAGLFTIGAMASLSSGFLKAASDNEEAARMMKDVFKGLEKSAQETAGNLAKYLNMDESGLQQQFAETAMMFQQMGFSIRESIDLSTDINKLGGDLAALTNYEGGATGATQALKQALMGMSRPLRALGVVINDTQIRTQMLKDKMDGLTFASQEQAKTYATYKVIMESTANAQGQLTREQGSFAESTQRLGAELANLQGTIGDTFVQPIAKANAKMAELIAKFNALPKEYQNLFLKGSLGATLAATAYFTAKPILETVDEVIQKDLHDYLGDGFKGLGIAVRDLSSGIGTFLRDILTRVGSLAGIVEGVAMLGGAFKGLYDGIKENEGVFNEIKGASVGFVKGLQQGAQALFDSIGAVDALTKALLDSSAKKGFLSWFMGFKDWTPEDQAKQEQLDRDQKARAEKIAEQEKQIRKQEYIDRGGFQMALSIANRDIAIANMEGVNKAQAEYSIALENYNNSLKELKEKSENSASSQEELETAVEQYKNSAIALTESTKNLEQAQKEEEQRLKEEQTKGIELNRSKNELYSESRFAGAKSSSYTQLVKLREQQAIALQEYDDLVENQLIDEEKQISYQRNLLSLRSQIADTENRIADEESMRTKRLEDRKKDLEEQLEMSREQTFLRDATNAEQQSYYTSKLAKVDQDIAGFEERQNEIDQLTTQIEELNEAIETGADTSVEALNLQMELVKKRNEMEDDLYADQKELYAKRSELENELWRLRQDEQSEMEQALEEAEGAVQPNKGAIVSDSSQNAVELGSAEASQMMARITDLYQQKIEKDTRAINRNTVAMNIALQRIANDNTHIMDVEA